MAIHGGSPRRYKGRVSSTEPSEGGAPPNALQDENGNYILDENGQYILAE